MISRLKDQSIINDFMGETFAKNLSLEVLTMDNAPAVLAHATTLINAKYEAYNLVGIRSYQNIFRFF